MPPIQGWMGGGEILFFYKYVTPSGFLIYALSGEPFGIYVLNFDLYKK
jgi:hypothetical protein